MFKLLYYKARTSENKQESNQLNKTEHILEFCHIFNSREAKYSITN